MNPPAPKPNELRIDPASKRRPRRIPWTIFLVVTLIAAASLVVWKPWSPETSRVVNASGAKPSNPDTPRPSNPAAPPPTAANDVVLTVSGYIINRERIELSPRFMGQVRWIGVRKGDSVTNGQVVVLLDDTEYRAQKRELTARLAAARVQTRRAARELERIEQLADARIETERALDLARLDQEAALAEVDAIEGQLERIETWLDWTVIRSPINGVVLEKMVDPNELVTPQSFGGARGPSTALISVGDPQDLQVEIDLNEADLSKVQLGQKCRVSPEAYPDKVYPGVVAEIAPEASRLKGTLQIKVQILNPDRFLTPELSAKVDFLAEGGPAAQGVQN